MIGHAFAHLERPFKAGPFQLAEQGFGRMGRVVGRTHRFKMGDRGAGVKR